MKFKILGKTGLKVSVLSFGASSLGGVFGDVNEAEAIKTVHTALDLGINYFDVSPAYGGTVAEIILGKALKGISRDHYYLSTKVGKYTEPGKYGADLFDYSRSRIRTSIEESSKRLGCNYFDIIHLHDFEYHHRQNVEWALNEGISTLFDLKREGKIGNVSCGIYPIDLWQRIFANVSIDAALVHNHYTLADTRAIELIPLAQQKNIGIINASPFASGLLTGREAPRWHPASVKERELFHRAAKFCEECGTSIGKLALQFSSQHPDIPTTLFSSASSESVRRNIAWHAEPCDPFVVLEVQRILTPIMNKQWDYDQPVLNSINTYGDKFKDNLDVR